MASKSFFDELNAKIKKNVKGVHTSIMAQSDIASISDWIETPSLDLNRILSGDLHKGIPNRSLVGVVGPEHTMKSSFMVLCMAEAQKQGYYPVIIDTERGVETEFCKRWGLDTENAFYIYTPWEDKIRSVLAQLKESDQRKMIIGIDSVGGIDRYKSYEDALGGDPKADQGLLQKNIRSLLKLLLNISIEQESISIVTGHLYGAPSMVPMPDKVGGGKAMSLFPSILISLKKTALKNSKKEIIGNEITATTIKNRMYPPFQQATVSIDYMKGINVYAGILPLLQEAGIVGLDGNTYYILSTKEKVGVGYTNAENKLEKFPVLLDELNIWLKNTGYSNVNSEIAREVDELEGVAEVAEEEVSKSRKKKARR